MTRKNFYKVIFMTADELFFLFFTHALPLSPSPQRTYGVKRLFPNFYLSYSILQGGREGELQNIFEDVALFYEGTQDLQLFYFILFYQLCQKKKNKQTERWHGPRNSRGQLQRARILIKNKNKKYLKKHSDTRKLQLHTTSYWTRQGTSTITF